MAAQEPAPAEAVLEEQEALPEESGPLVIDGIEVIDIPVTEDRVTFTFAGDLLLDSYYAAGATIAAVGLANSFDEQALQIMRGSDIFVINNEFTYTNAQTPQPNKTFTFHANPAMASQLFDIGVDLAELANNHTFDYQETGLLDTLATLEGIGMPYVGAGRNIEEARRPVYYRANGMIIAVLNATQIERYDNPDTRGATETLPGVMRCFDGSLLYQTVREVSEKADYVIVSVHWGTEKENYFEYSQSSQAQELKNAGADLVIGGHPHVLQGFDYIEGMPVVYSLGNYLFTSYTTDTGVARITLIPSEKRMESLQFIPMLQENCRVRTLQGVEKDRVLANLRAYSPQGVVIDADGFVTKP